MPSPRLRRVSPTDSRVSGLAICSRHIFEVVISGERDGRQFDLGELVLTSGEAMDGDDIVLVPAGRGRPMFGSLDDGVLRGASGEARSGSRWVIAGRIIGTYRQTGRDWFYSAVAGANRAPGRQLSLFAA